MRVRQARPEDAPALVALFQELDAMQREWRVFTPRPGFYDEVGRKYREAIRLRDAVVLVAEDDEGEIVGMSYGEVNAPSRFSDERALEISGVVVRGGHRGRGVGRALVREAARFASTHGVPWVELKTFAPNEGSMAFWTGLGFTPRVVQLISSTAALEERMDAD
jgi:GNAT superfamily N-acetyltransferase